MKAVVLHAFGAAPRYEDFPDPVPGPEETILQVRAVALENIDKALARGAHYANRQLLPTLPAVVGTDGIGLRDDGQLVGFGGIRPPYGALAEYVAVPRLHTMPIPAGVDAATAAAVPSSALTSLFSLTCAARLQPGETVVVNGATGFAGKLAIQVARLLGAGRVVGAGRHDATLHALRDLGADAVIDLKQPDDALLAAFRQEAEAFGCHVILDFLWGHPTELLIQALTPQDIAFAKQRIRLVQVGEMAGSTLSLAAEALRTSGLEIIGAGSGITPEAVAEGASQAWEWITAGKLRADIEQVPLRDVESAWARAGVAGKRLVIVP